MGRICSFILLLMTSLARADEPGFVISYWDGPPPQFTTLDRYRQIKEANFTLVMPAHGTMSVAENRRMLDFCRELGLKAIVADVRMPCAIGGNMESKTAIEQIVKDYGDHPALFAYFVKDEPGMTEFAGLGEVVAYLKELDPKHPGYINLFPIHADKKTQLGTESYDEYLKRFIETVKPFVVSYDHYAMTKHGDGPEFHQNLAVVRNTSTAAGLPFWNIVLSLKHYDYRLLSEAELRFQGMQTLAFGARGLLWYTYWYPGQPNPAVEGAMINFDGSRNEHYDMIRRVNAEARALGTELLAGKSWATFHQGEGSMFQPPPGNPLRLQSDGKWAIGIFDASDGRWMALVANRDYTQAANASMSIENATKLEQFDIAGMKWRPVERGDDGAIRIELPPAGASLFRWQQ